MQILYEDENIIGTAKPPGMPVQPDKTGSESLLEMLEKQIKNKLWILHRLDRNVGGVIVFAKNKESASLKLQEKRYKAVLCGIPPKNAVIENYILKNQRLNLSKIVAKNTPCSKYALLEYNIQKTISINNENLTLADIKLETGRHHQIRVQMAHMGFPIYGDMKYNPDCHRSSGVALWSYKAVINSVSIEKMPSGGIWENFGF